MKVTFLEALLEGYLAAKRRVNIVQIGANDGKFGDPLYPFVMRHRMATRILLIEPQSEVLPFLREHYAGHPDATIHCGAIGKGDRLVLFRVKPELWNSYNVTYLHEAPAYRVPSGFASSSIEHVRGHAEGNLRTSAGLDDGIERIEVPCTTLHALVTQLDWGPEVDILQIDAEGADDEVVYASDTQVLRPRIVNYERSHLTEERRQRLEAFLVRQGYRLFHWSGSDTLAVLQD